MSGEMKWLLLSMLVSLGRGKFCRDSGSSCSCQVVSDWKWEIRCPSDSDPKFIAHFDMDAGNCRVECKNATSWSELGYQSTRPLFDSWTTLTIERCPLPDESFDHVTKRFGLLLATDLTFTSHMNLRSTLTRRHLSMLSALHILNLSLNGLTELASDLFRDMGSLELLDLSFNEIEMLPRDIFHGLSVLRRIDLSYNAMKFVDWRSFDNCTNLERLSLRGNLLTSLDGWIFNNTGRLYLDVAENQLETLPHYILRKTKAFLSLNLSANKFSLLPERVFGSVSLTHIILSDNVGNLTTLPSLLLSNLFHLETVVLARNALKVLPETIFWGDIRLQRVDLHGNALSSIPQATFWYTEELVYLDLSENKLTSLPPILFQKLRKLEWLNLENNAITNISNQLFLYLSSLLELNLGSNRIGKIEWRSFAELKNLRVMRLSHNLVNLEAQAPLRHFHQCKNLQKLFLDHNNLTDGFYNYRMQYRPPANLQFVDLTYNYISVIWVMVPMSGSQDIEYDFRHNKVVAVNLMGMPDAKVRVLVDDNPIYCGCSLYIAFGYMEANRQSKDRSNLEIVPGNAVCGGPSWMMNVSVADLTLETFTCRPDQDDQIAYCAEECDCWWIPHNTTRLVDCRSRNIEEVPQRLIEFREEQAEERELVLDRRIDDRNKWFDWQKSPVKLDLSDNSLVEIPPLNASGYKYVGTLILSRNNISKLSFDVLPPRLKVLDLDHNNLENFDRVASNAIMNSAALKKLNIEGNSWSCDSDTRRNLNSMENKLGPNLRYFTMECLDYRDPPNIKKKNTLYVSYTIF